MIGDLFYVNGKRNVTELIMSVITPILLGILSFMLVKNYAGKYIAHIQSIIPLPLPILFTVIWFLALVLMGMASYRAKLASPESVSHVYYAAQVLCAFIWNIILLRFYETKIAFVTIIVYIFFLTAAFFEFDKIDKRAGRLLLPVIAWAIIMLAFNYAGL